MLRVHNDHLDRLRSGPQREDPRSPYTLDLLCPLHVMIFIAARCRPPGRIEVPLPQRFIRLRIRAGNQQARNLPRASPGI